MLYQQVRSEGSGSVQTSMPPEPSTHRAPPRAPSPPALGLLYLIVLIDAMGMSLVFPVLPELIRGFAGSRELQSYWYGALTAAFGLMQFLMSPLLGAWSDRFGRRPLLLISVFGLGLDFLFMALAPNLWWLLIARLVGGATAANVSVANAYIADVTEANDRIAAMGRLGAVFGLGFAIGPVLGGVLGEQDLRLPFFVAAGLSLMSWLVALRVLPESLPVERRTAFSWAKANPFAALKDLIQLKAVSGAVWVFTLTVLAQFILEVTWVLYTSFRFGWGPWLNGLSLCVVGIVLALVQGLWLAPLLRWLGESRLIRLGLLSSTLSFVAYGLATESWVMFATIGLNLLGFAVWPALQGLISNSVDASRQGVTLGALNAITSLCTVIAPLIGSSLFAQVTHGSPGDWQVGAPYFLAALLQGLGLVIAMRFLARRLLSDARRPPDGP